MTREAQVLVFGRRRGKGVIAFCLGAVLVTCGSLLAYSRTAGSAVRNPGLFESEVQTTAAPLHVKRSSSALAITTDGQTLLVVNPDSDSLSIVDLAGGSPVTEVAVGDDPRTVTVSDDGSRAYTANRAGNSISVIDLPARQAIAEVPVGARPYGVVVSPDGRTLYVAEQGHDRLSAVNTATQTRTWDISLPDRPSGLALSDDGRVLYVTHLLRNSLTMLVLPQPRSYLPIVTASGAGKNRAPRHRASAGSPKPRITSTVTLWPDSNLVQSIVIAPAGERAYIPHTRSNNSNKALTLDTTVFPLVSVVDLPSGTHLAGESLNLSLLDPPAVGLPFDAAITPDGAALWVLNAASNDVTVIDPAVGRQLAHVEVGANPRGIVTSPDGGTVYVNNTLSGTLSVVDTSTYTVTATISVTSLSLDPELLSGKRLFHSSDDPRLGKDQWMSCNTCHFDGENDGRTWHLGFAGPRNTTSLLGMSETVPLRWSGEWDEAADAEFAIRMDSFGTGLIDGPLHCSLDPPDCVHQPPHAGLSAELDALAAYINSLTVPLSPDYNPGQPLSEAATRGSAHFNNPAVGCAVCHPAPRYTDNLNHNVGMATADERIGPIFNTPSLRGIHDTAPYFHDGSAATLYDAVTRSTERGEHDVSSKLNAAEIEELIAFLLSLPYGE